MDRAVETAAAMVPNGTLAATGRDERRLKRAYYFTISPRPVTQTIALNAARFWRERPQEMILAGALALAGIVAACGLGRFDADASGLRSAQDAHARARRPCWSASFRPTRRSPSTRASRSTRAPTRPRALLARQGRCSRRAPARSSASPAPSTTRRARRAPTASAPSPRSSSTASAIPAFPANVCGVVYEGSTRATGLPVHLHLRRLADRAADARGLAAGAFGRRGRACRLRLQAGRHRHPLSRRLCRSLLGADADQERRRSARTSSIAGLAAGAVRPPSRRAISHREPSVDALRSAAILAERRDVATRGQSAATAEAIAEIPGAEALKLAPSMRGDKRVAVRFNLDGAQGHRRSRAQALCREGPGLRQSALDAERRRNGRGRRKAARQGDGAKLAAPQRARRPARPNRTAPSGAHYNFMEWRE